jgi:hypothetical protein
MQADRLCPDEPRMGTHQMNLFFEENMSVSGQTLRFDHVSRTSAPPRTTDITRSARLDVECQLQTLAASSGPAADGSLISRPP